MTVPALGLAVLPFSGLTAASEVMIQGDDADAAAWTGSTSGNTDNLSAALANVFLRPDTRTESNLTDSMLASAQYVFDWDNTPAQGIPPAPDDDRADRADPRFVLSLGWSFGG